MMTHAAPRNLPWILLAILGAAVFLFALSGCLGSYEPTPTPDADPSASAPPAPSGGGNPAAAPAAASTNAQHCLDTLNHYRAQAGVAALKASVALDQFATVGSLELQSSGAAHQHFSDAGNQGTLFASGFCGGASENQAPGWPAADVNATIDSILASMMSEGPGGGHHDNIVDPNNALVGVGLALQNGQLWFTNDFSPACP